MKKPVTRPKEVIRPKSPPRKRSSPVAGLRILAVMIGVPLAVLLYQAHNSGLSMGDLFAHIFKGARQNTAEAPSHAGGELDSGRHCAAAAVPGALSRGGQHYAL